MSLLFEPLTFDFMRQAYAITLLISLPMAVLSCFLVLKGWSLLGDAIAHAVLPGVVLAYLLAIPLGVGAFAAAMLCAVATGYLNNNSRIKEDTVMGVVFSGMFAGGIVLYTAIETEVHLDHILFGDILGIIWADVLTAAIVVAFASLVLALFSRDLLAMLFDPQHAKAIGLRPQLLTYGLLALLSLCVVAALKAVGIILAIALLISPGAIAFLLTDRFGAMVRYAIAIAMGCSVVGITASFYLDSAPAPTIVVTLTLLFIVVFIGTLVRRRSANQR